LCRALWKNDEPKQSASGGLFCFVLNHIFVSWRPFFYCFSDILGVIIKLPVLFQFDRIKFYYKGE